MPRYLSPIEREMQKISHELLKKHAPLVHDAIKEAMQQGTTAKKIEQFLTRVKFPESLTVHTAVLAARYMQANPDTLKD